MIFLVKYNLQYTRMCLFTNKKEWCLIKGKKIKVSKEGLVVPNNPIIPFIEGDGIGPDIWKATKNIIDSSVEKVYSGEKRIVWKEVLAGEKAYARKNEWLPEETINTIRNNIVAIKGPLTTPIGGGFRSLNVAIRHALDLYACVRPIEWIPGVPSPVKHPEKVDMVIFRENMEDTYAGYEWPAGKEETLKIIDFFKKLNVNLSKDSGIGLKPVSRTGSRNIIRKAYDYAIKNNKKSVTIVHKGNIMKYTEGAFKNWGLELAKEEYSDIMIAENDLYENYNGNLPEGKILVKDRIADNMFQQILLRSDEYDVIVTTNVNGDYLSDAAAAQVGGLGVAYGGNIGDNIAVFEATHGTAPKYAGMDKVNPTALILSGAFMLEYMGWEKCSKTINKALRKTVEQKIVTYDLARQMKGAKKVKTSQFADAVIKNMD